MTAVRDIVPGVISNDAVWSSSVTQLVDDGSATLGGSGWTNYAAGGGSYDAAYGGQIRYNQAGAGSDTALWAFTGLTPGHAYKVVLGWGTASDSATNTPYIIFDSDGITVLASGTVNQVLNPTGVLATVTPSGSSLSLKITDAANNYVIADVAAVASGSGAIPGSGDTITGWYSHTIDVDWTIGNSPSTDGTAAYAFGGVPGATLDLAANKVATLKADLAFVNTGNATTFQVLSLEAGSTFKFLPASGQHYDFKSVSGSWAIDTAGTANSRCTIKCDLSLGGLPGTMSTVTFRYVGLRSVAYTDFTDFSSLVSRYDGDDAGMNVSLSNVTFLRAPYSFVGLNGWLGTCTLTDVVWSGSTDIDVACAYFYGPSGTFSFNRCSWDAALNVRDGINSTFNLTNCHLANGADFGTTNSWSSADQFSQNVVVHDYNVMQFYGPVRDTIVIHLEDAATSNPHFINGPSFLRVGLEYPYAGNSVGDGAYGGTVVRCITFPGPDGYAPCFLTKTGTCQQNTVMQKGVENGMMGLGETVLADVGSVPICINNIVYSTSYNPSDYCFAIKSGGSGGSAVDAVTDAGYNVFSNGNSGTNYYNTNTQQDNVIGYSGLKIARNSAYPNVQVGHNDITNWTYSFIDMTLRSFCKWGQVVHGTDGSLAAAQAIITADRTLIYTAGPRAAIPWCFAGYAPTGANGLLVKDNGFGSVTRGAMEYVAASGTDHGARMRRLRRP